MKILNIIIMKPHTNTDRAPAIILGGDTIALAAARSLGRRGIEVYALDEPASYARHSRYCKWIPLKDRDGSGISRPTVWYRWLMEEGVKTLQGAVLIPGSDHGLEIIGRHYEELKKNYIVTETDPNVLSSMLDKAKTYELAGKIGILTPKMWSAHSADDITRIMDEIPYPCAVKPRHSYKFMEHFPGKKLFVAHNHTEMLEIINNVKRYNLEVIINEIIPGKEDAYCSYYTYLDEDGKPLFHFTKRKLRQYPVGFGNGTYHCTDWNPEVAKLGLEFFQKIGYRGLGNVEFKLDARDAKLKLIECNSRLTLVTELIRQSGLDLPLLLYQRATKQPPPPLNGYRKELYTVLPVVDFLAFRELHRRGELSWFQWLRSLRHKFCFLHFAWHDPLPTLVRFYPFVKKQFRKLGVNLFRRGHTRHDLKPILSK
ncbi:MAG: hypothetical protein HY707_07335 [Ignavibacteriae bacterium]|nr:hypothetical protein [Ignavibacteriota bacterium]